MLKALISDLSEMIWEIKKNSRKENAIIMGWRELLVFGCNYRKYCNKYCTLKSWWVWWSMPALTTLVRLRQKSHRIFEAAKATRRVSNKPSLQRKIMSQNIWMRERWGVESCGEKVFLYIMGIQLNKLTKTMHNCPNVCQITTHIVKFTNVLIVRW